MFFWCCDTEPRDSKWVTSSCCFCANLQTGSFLTAAVGFLGAFVLLILQTVNGFSAAIALSAAGVLVLSIVLAVGTMFERPWPVLAYVVCLGLPLWFLVGYFVYYIYVCATSEIKVEAYVPLCVAVFLGKACYMLVNACQTPLKLSAAVNVTFILSTSVICNLHSSSIFLAI